MKLFVLLSSFIIVQAYYNSIRVFDLNGLYYDKNTLYYASKHELSSLEVEYTTNTLYFTEKLEALTFDLDSERVEPMLGITNVTSLTVDQLSHIVFIGTTNGIYKYDVNNRHRNTPLVGTEGKSILNMYFNRGLYYSDQVMQSYYTLVDGNSSELVEINHRDKFVIDNEGDMFFLSGDGLYRQVKGTKHAVLYKDAPVGRGLTADRNGKIYYYAKDGIYEVKKHSTKVEQLFSFYDPKSLTFDRENNMIYCDNSMIYILKKTTKY